MNTKVLTFTILGVLLLFVFIVVGSFISTSNTEIELRTTFEQKIDERTAFYDKMKKVISQKAQIAIKNDSSFQNMVNTIMSARKDGQQVMFKWIQESNPGANFNEVSKLYADLSRTIEGQREGFFEEEKMIQDVVKQHKMLIRKFPASIVFSFLDRKELKYTPIQSSETQDVMKTGVDNDTKVF